VPFLVLMLLSATVEVPRAQSITIADATIQAGLAAAVQRTRYQKPCDPKRRALAGAAIGFVMGMIVVRRVAAEYDATVGAKDTLGAGGYGAAIGAFVALKTCR
jgi:hypothetical protein